MVSEIDQIAHTRLRRDGQRYTDNRRQLVHVLAESPDPLTSHSDDGFPVS